MERRRNKGFTLMEMLIVVAIIAILVAIAIPTFAASLDAAREATCAANRRSLKGVLSTVYMTEGEDAVKEYYGDHKEDYTCPSGGKITYQLNGETGVLVVSCSVHSSPNLTMVEIYQDYFDRFQDPVFKKEIIEAVGSGGANDILRKYYYKMHNGWPYFQESGQTYYVQPYVDAYGEGASNDVYLFANGVQDPNKGTSWNAKFFYHDGTWYTTKSGSATGFANTSWGTLAEKLKPMSSPPAITK